MDYLNDLGSLAIGTRFKRLSEYFYDEVEKIYSSLELDVPSRCFPVLHLLSWSGALSVNQIADSLGLTHPAISQVAAELKKRKLIKVEIDPNDKRRSLLTLSESARKIVAQLQPIWDHIRKAVDEVLSEGCQQLMDNLSQMERALALRPLSARIRNQIEQQDRASIRLCRWNPRYKNDFGVLNRAWLREYNFEIEPQDVLDFSNPKEQILDKGGMIFFALLDDVVVGTCAMFAMPNHSFELGKMAVASQIRGKRVGRQLLEFAEMWAKEKKARKIVLQTNSVLKAARALYESTGYKVIRSDNLHYARADTTMEKVL